MAFELKLPHLLLCEGAADQNLIRKLVAQRGIREFDMLPPHEYFSADAFHRMLTAARGAGHAFGLLRGVLIVADSTDDPASKFRNVRDQVERVRGYPVPAGPSVTAPRTHDHPAVRIILLPDDITPGCLETLYVRDILARYPWAEQCLDEFLRCGQIDAYSWPVEKRDKARFHALVAALHQHDPSRAASQALKEPHAVIGPASPVFDDLAARLAQFHASV